jgi:hypothetical protein
MGWRIEALKVKKWLSYLTLSPKFTLRYSQMPDGTDLNT